jgi:hypothetical protein
MFSILLIPDLHYDFRIWADLPDRLGEDCRVVVYDQHDPMPARVEPGDPAFLDAVRNLIPGQHFDVVVAAGTSAGFAFRLVLSRLASGLVLFQPFVNLGFDEHTAPDVPVADLVASANWIRPVIEALEETDLARRRELVVGAWRDRYGPHLAPADLELACAVIGDHAEELLASVQAVAASAERGEDMSWSGQIDAGRLGEINLPMAVVVSENAARFGEAIQRHAPDSEVLVAKAQTDLVWLEDRGTATRAIGDILLSSRQG